MIIAPSEHATHHTLEMLRRAAAAAVRWSSSTPKRPTVQVLHHNPPAQPYAQVEQDIAAMQREIRDAYKCVPIRPCV